VAQTCERAVVIIVMMCIAVLGTIVMDIIMVTRGRSTGIYPTIPQRVHMNVRRIAGDQRQ
jgi:hypothetical protein